MRAILLVDVLFKGRPTRSLEPTATVARCACSGRRGSVLAVRRREELQMVASLRTREIELPGESSHGVAQQYFGAPLKST